MLKYTLKSVITKRQMHAPASAGAGSLSMTSVFGSPDSLGITGLARSYPLTSSG